MQGLNMLPRWNSLIVFIVFSLSVSPLLFAAEENYSGNAEKYALPSWMNDRILAGYLYDYNDTGKIDKISSSGFNTLIIKSWKFDEDNLSDTLVKLERWGKACKQNDIHAFLAYNWQPQEIEIVKFRRAVFSDGSVARFNCPLDTLFWENHLIRIVRYLSSISTNSEACIDGVFLDMELYRTEDLPNIKRFYSQETCYCDSCFDGFLKEKGIKNDSAQIVAASRRYEYIQNKGLADDYRRFQVNKVLNLASEYRKVVENINPNLFLSIYPYPNTSDWVLNSLVETFGKANKPVLLFAVDTYYKGGHGSIPQAYGYDFNDRGIDALYIAGYLFRKYSSREIFENILKSGEKADGYWLYRLPQLWSQDVQENELAMGTTDDYWGAIKEANSKHRMRIFDIETLKIVK